MGAEERRGRDIMEAEGGGGKGGRGGEVGWN